MSPVHDADGYMRRLAPPSTSRPRVVINSDAAELA